MIRQMKLQKNFLEHKAYKLRVESLLMTSIAHSGHPSSCLSAADLMAALFFHALCFDPRNFKNADNDRFILSKGHAAPVFYAALKEMGLITDQELYTYRSIKSSLEGHPTTRCPYVEAATGSLGMGLSIGVGIALSALLDMRDFHTYVLLGDSELSEGSIWEACEIAAHYKLANLIGIVDCNRLGQTGPTLHGYDIELWSKKFQAFGWEVLVIDGHNINVIIEALDKARQERERPTVILAKTIKGFGATSIENKEGFHGKAFTLEETSEIIRQMEKRFPEASQFKDNGTWRPCIPENHINGLNSCIGASVLPPLYQKDQKIATRQAYGDALVELGRACSLVVSLDAEVKNSTFAQNFEKFFPLRFYQCFIAEQNMVSMGVGMASRGKIPFISTFGAFFTRAFDQLRLAAISNSPLRCVGSHAGISIGQDGPSQMALEDIAMFSTLPGSAILYPSDAVSTHRLLEEMLEYNQGISYLRTTRASSPVIYDVNEEFVMGGCKVIRSSNNDIACVIAAGITLFEALKAYEQLAFEGISVSVIDLYSIKPLDRATILATAKSSSNKIITVEDHYMYGGIGNLVRAALCNENIMINCLAVKELPRSGKPEELMAWAEIDSQAIIRLVKNINKPN